MLKFDLSNYDLSELKGLQYNLAKEIKVREQQDIQKAREALI